MGAGWSPKVNIASEELSVSTSSGVRPYDFLLSKLSFDMAPVGSADRDWSGEWAYKG